MISCQRFRLGRATFVGVLMAALVVVGCGARSNPTDTRALTTTTPSTPSPRPSVTLPSPTVSIAKPSPTLSVTPLGIPNLPNCKKAWWTTATPPEGIVVTLTTSKRTYRVGEMVKFTLTAKNTGSETVDYRTATGQSYDGLISAGKSGIRLWSDGMVTTGAEQKKTLAPGGQETGTFEWNQHMCYRDSSFAGSQVPRGIYSAEALWIAKIGEWETPGSGWSSNRVEFSIT